MPAAKSTAMNMSKRDGIWRHEDKTVDLPGPHVRETRSHTRMGAHQILAPR